MVKAFWAYVGFSRWNEAVERLRELVVPIDTHMCRICTELGLTRRRAPDLRMALDVTEGFRRIRPDDPVRYDFALTRLGIRDDADLAGFLDACRK